MIPLSRHALLAVLITFITICGIFNCLLRTQASATLRARKTSQIISGRWQLVHASLGLEHLPATIAPSLPTSRPQTPHRVNFRARKRTAPSLLRFTPDALHKPRVSLKELVVLFRRIALEEAKADTARGETKKGRGHSVKPSVRKGHGATSR